MANQQRKPRQPQPPIKLDAHYVKSSHYRTIHADGVWGGITPQLNIQMAFYSEHHPIPEIVHYEVKPGEPLKEVKRTASEGVVREVEAEMIVSLELAESVVRWLNGKIEEVKKFQKEAERLQG